MLKLATVFENAAGKNHRWSYNNPDPNKTADQIKAALEAMTTLNLFQKDGVRQFYKVVSAKFVETIETPIFDLSQQAETYVADPNNAFAPLIIADEPTQVSELAEEPKQVEAIEVPKAAVTEEKTEQPAVVEAARQTAPKTIAAAPAAEFVPEKAAIHSQAKAVLDTALVNPVATSAKDPVVNLGSLTKAAEKPVQADTVEHPAETVPAEPETPVAESLAVKKPTNPRKEKVDRLRAYHEANKKKAKKGKKKKR
ncbi:DUF2922 family protein [Enterococcus sp. 669A]|uniref:DUF2922 family protein n=1 Tax=Candidatus Enterococcus moelleringii TaxID=2815325 RepID=A0ABS3LBK8_9ENTE|nr:DUF2922 domain-containing protein [Enterococcus sp. 669A]MBO1307011.1 DUF2922 family protein [Enterococcus sp. 669A]